MTEVSGNHPECDPTDGACSPAGSASSSQPATTQVAGAEIANSEIAKAEIANAEIVYVGDPMCSWCWGISPGLQQLQRYCAGKGMACRVVVGGLRPGGGDPWNSGFRHFLSTHWREVGARTGQPFSFALMEREFFNYDTEPACRAVVAARPLMNGTELDFFTAVQRKFYVDNEDPAGLPFYRDICASLQVDFDAFAERFGSEAVKRATAEEFALNRSWGVTGYPTVLAFSAERRFILAIGFATFEAMRQRLHEAWPQLA